MVAILKNPRWLPIRSLLLVPLWVPCPRNVDFVVEIKVPGHLESKIVKNMQIFGSHFEKSKMAANQVNAIGTIRFLAPENVNLVVEIKILGHLEAVILNNISILAAILKNPRWPPCIPRGKWKMENGKMVF